MSKKTVLAFTLLALVACFLSYKIGSSPAVHAQSLPPAPAEWVLEGGGSGTFASVTKPSVAGVQHVADCVSMTGSTIGTGAVPIAATVSLLDGNTIVMLWEFPLATYASGANHVSLCGLSVVGTAGNSMTLRFNGSQNTSTSLSEETVNLIGHDAQ
jgi:hypothetical protein